jgi:hypothetical protein
MRRGSVLLIVLLAAALWAGPVRAGSDPATTTPGVTPTTPAAAPAPAQGQVPLILSIREMALSATRVGDTGDMDRVRSTNGSGTSSWPSPNTPIARGVYFSFSPSCIPGVDEPLVPQRARRR